MVKAALAGFSPSPTSKQGIMAYYSPPGMWFLPIDSGKIMCYYPADFYVNVIAKVIELSSSTNQANAEAKN